MNKYNKPFHTGISTIHQRKKKPEVKRVPKRVQKKISVFTVPVTFTFQQIKHTYYSFFSNQYSKKLLTAKSIFDKIQSLTK